MLPPSHRQFDSDSESEAGSIPDTGDTANLLLSDSDSDDGAATSGTTTEPVAPRQRPAIVLPVDAEDPCGEDDRLSESARVRLEEFFSHLGPSSVGDVRPVEPEWQPSRSVSEWAEAIWQSVPPALRWWVESVEGHNPLSEAGQGKKVLRLLRELVKSKTDTERFAYIRLLFESQGCPREYLPLLQSPETVFEAFPEAFGRSEYKWDDDTSPLERVLSVVDCFVTLCEPEPIPSMLEWDPVTRVLEPAFKSGRVHEPEFVRRAWEHAWLRKTRVELGQEQGFCKADKEGKKDPET